MKKIKNLLNVEIKDNDVKILKMRIKPEKIDDVIGIIKKKYG